MTKEIKIPNAVMDILREAAACDSLSKQYGSGWFPSPRAVVYAIKRTKLENFATRAMAESCPATAEGEWEYDLERGVATKIMPPAPPKVRKPRAPKVPKPVAAVVPPVAPVVKVEPAKLK